MEPDTSPLPADDRLPFAVPFTTRQARSLGISADVLTRLCREGLLRRVFKGVYLDAAAEDTQLIRAQALSLVVPDTAVVTDDSAAWVHGADLHRRGDHVIPPPISVYQLPGNTRVRKQGSRGGERSFVADDLEVVHGVLVTTRLRTALDMGRLTSPDHAIGALDALLRLGGFDREQLLEEVGRFKGFRGVVQLRELAPLADARAESPAESVMRLRWIRAGLPACDLQIPILSEWGIEQYRLDMGLPEIRYAAEYDGADWHSSPQQRAHDRERRARIRNRSGWVVDVLTKKDLFGPHQRAAQIFRNGIAQARVRRRAA
jgi:hypothetical protein